MDYEILIVDDSGAVEFTENYFDLTYNQNHYKKYTEENKKFATELPPVLLEMYDDNDFNSLHNFLHCLEDYIIDEKVKDILSNHHLPNHTFIPATVFRKERKMFLKMTKKYLNYYWLYIDCSHIENYYQFIDFEKSEINFSKNDKLIEGLKIESVQEIYNIIDNNKKISAEINRIYKEFPNNKFEIKKRITESDLYGIDWRTEKIVLNEEFDYTLDVFQLPLFSPRTYVSKRLKQELIKNNITNIEFKKTGNNPDPNYILNPELIINNSY